MIRLVGFTAVLAVIFFVVSKYLVPHWIHPEIWTMLLFFFVLSLIAYRLAHRGFGTSRLAPFYLAVTALRLVLCVVFVGYFIFQRVDDLLVFVINFFILYLLYVGFEITSLLSNLRRN